MRGKKDRKAAQYIFDKIFPSWAYIRHIGSIISVSVLITASVGVYLARQKRLFRAGRPETEPSGMDININMQGDAIGATSN